MELKEYLTDADSWLLATFRDGEQGRAEFSKFMKLVREQQDENEQLKKDKKNT